jgi:hypothetical protein
MEARIALVRFGSTGPRYAIIRGLTNDQLVAGDECECRMNVQEQWRRCVVEGVEGVGAEAVFSVRREIYEHAGVGARRSS